MWPVLSITAHTCRFALATIIMDSCCCWRRQNNCVIAFCGDRAFVSRRRSGRDHSPTIHHPITWLAHRCRLLSPSICLYVRVVSLSVRLLVCLHVPSPVLSLFCHLHLIQIQIQVVIRSCCCHNKYKNTQNSRVSYALMWPGPWWREKYPEIKLWLKFARILGQVI